MLAVLMFGNFIGSDSSKGSDNIGSRGGQGFGSSSSLMLVVLMFGNLIDCNNSYSDFSGPSHQVRA